MRSEACGFNNAYPAVMAFIFLGRRKHMKKKQYENLNLSIVFLNDQDVILVSDDLDWIWPQDDLDWVWSQGDSQNG